MQGRLRAACREMLLARSEEGPAHLSLAASASAAACRFAEESLSASLPLSLLSSLLLLLLLLPPPASLLLPAGRLRLRCVLAAGLGSLRWLTAAGLAGDTALPRDLLRLAPSRDLLRLAASRDLLRFTGSLGLLRERLRGECREDLTGDFLRLASR